MFVHAQAKGRGESVGLAEDEEFALNDLFVPRFFDGAGALFADAADLLELG